MPCWSKHTSGPQRLLHHVRTERMIMGFVELFLARFFFSQQQGFAPLVCVAARVLLPRMLVAAVRDRMLSGRFVAPSPNTISKASFTIDVAWTSHAREGLKRRCSRGVVAHIMVDSSPQRGRDFE